jgi:predicted PurR-regulated permease PerM
LLLGLAAGTGALLALTAFIGVHRLRTVLLMLVLAAFLAIGLDRPVRALMRRGLSRTAAVAVLFGVLNLAGCGFLALVVPSLAGQVEGFFAALPGYLDQLTSSGLLAKLEENTNVASALAGVLTPSNVASLLGGVLGGTLSVLTALMLGLTTVLIMFFVLAALDRLRAGAYHLVAASRRERVAGLADAVLTRISAYLVGAIGIAACAGTATFLYAVIVGLPYPLVMAVVVAAFDLIPQVGATIGATVVVLVALTVSLPLALGTIAFFLCYQGLENWVIYPRMMGRAVKVSNLAAIVSALVGGALFGVTGVLIAVPAYASIQLIVREVVFPRRDVS